MCCNGSKAGFNCRIDEAKNNQRAIAIGYSSLASPKVLGRADRLPNVLFLLMLFCGLYDFLAFDPFGCISRH